MQGVICRLKVKIKIFLKIIIKHKMCCYNIFMIAFLASIFE